METKKKDEQTDFLATLWKLGYPLADVVGKVVRIDNPDGNVTRGFQDANGRRQIAVTFTKEKFRAWIEEEYETLKKG